MQSKLVVFFKEVGFDFLSKIIRRWGFFLFPQECTPLSHRMLIRAWFLENNVSVPEWPSQSPDLNPIENVWREPKKRVMARKSFDIKNLEIFAKDEWSKIPVETCRDLVTKYKNHLEAVIKNKGFDIDY